jgi:hypothetical protein
MAKHITAKDLENAKKYAEKIEKEMKEKEVWEIGLLFCLDYLVNSVGFDYYPRNTRFSTA